MAIKTRETVPDELEKTAGKDEKPPEKPSRRRVGTVPLMVMTVLAAILLTVGIAWGVRSAFAAGDVATGTVIDGVREFRIEGPQWEFEPRVIRVSPGETVRFVVQSPDITHGFAINELGINISFSPGNDGIAEVVIPADSPTGTYTMYCSIFCGSGHSHMKGTIIVGGGGADGAKVLPFAATSLMVVIFGGFLVVARREAR